jgi:hypothetical protein
MSRLSEEHDMTISDDEDLARLKEIGRIVANTLEAMGKALEPGMTTSELDRIGRTLLEAAGARSAPELAYDFPGATCISVNEEIAHGGADRSIRAHRDCHAKRTVDRHDGRLRRRPQATGSRAASERLRSSGASGGARLAGGFSGAAVWLPELISTGADLTSR